MTIYPCPKPPKAKAGKLVGGGKPRPKIRKPMKKTRMKAVNRKRGGSSFPAVRDRKFCRFVVEETRCVGEGLFFSRAVSLHDQRCQRNRAGGWRIEYAHACWGPNDPAHVGQHRSKGAPDFGHVANMCRALHDFYDQHRGEFTEVTQITERQLEHIAQGNTVKYVERGGTPTQGAT